MQVKEKVILMVLIKYCITRLTLFLEKVGLLFFIKAATNTMHWGYTFTVSPKKMELNGTGDGELRRELCRQSTNISKGG